MRVVSAFTSLVREVLALIRETIQVIMVLVTLTIPLWCGLMPLGLLLFSLWAPVAVLQMVGRKVIQRFLRRPVVEVRPSLHVFHHPSAGPAQRDLLFFIHGWPDCADLFKRQVEYFSERGYCCTTVTLPGFGPGASCPSAGIDFDELVGLLRQELRKVNEVRDHRVVVFAHDWGCYLARLLSQQDPELIHRVVLVDIAWDSPRSMSFAVMVLSYQLYLVSVFLLGGPAGNFLMRGALWLFKYRARPLSECRAQMCYPYYYLWRAIIRTRGKALTLGCPRKHPVFFVYGEKKKIMFHSDKWLQDLAQDPMCGVKAMKSDHWVPTHEPTLLNYAAHEWLVRSGSGAQ